MDKTDELLQHVDGEIFKTNPKTCMTELNGKIIDAAIKYEETQHVGRFLKSISYRSNITLIQGDEGADDDSEDDCDEHFFDDFIPNDFDESCNFKRNDAEHRYADFFKRNDINLKRKATCNIERSISKKRIEFFV